MAEWLKRQTRIDPLNIRIRSICSDIRAQVRILLASFLPAILMTFWHILGVNLLRYTVMRPPMILE